MPKRIGQSNPEMLARLVARPIDLLAVSTKPFVLLSVSTRTLLRLLGVRESTANAVTEEEIHAMLEEGTTSGIIESNEHAMVRNVFRLDQNRQIASLMVPRGDVVVLDLNLPFEQNMAKVEASDRRAAGVDGDLNHVVDVVHARKWLSQALKGGGPRVAERSCKPRCTCPKPSPAWSCSTTSARRTSTWPS